MKIILILMVIVIASSCGTGAYHTATPIGKGSNELGAFASGAYVSPVIEYYGSDDSSKERSEFLPNFELTYRRGLTSWSDIGVQVGFGTIQVDYNMAVINTEDFALSIDPQFMTFLTVPIRTRLGIYVDLIKTSEGAIFSLNLAPGFRFDEGPSVGGGFLAKLPFGAAFLLIFLEADAAFGRLGADVEIAQSVVSGGVGVAYGF